MPQPNKPFPVQSPGNGAGSSGSGEKTVRAVSATTSVQPKSVRPVPAPASEGDPFGINVTDAYA